MYVFNVEEPPNIRLNIAKSTYKSVITPCAFSLIGEVYRVKKWNFIHESERN